MKTIIILACMELSGIGIDIKSLQELLSVISNKMQSLETEAYNLAGRKFNFLSSKEVGQVCKVWSFILHVLLYLIVIYNFYKMILNKCEKF